MSKKRLIRKMALPAAIAFVTSIIILLVFEGPVENQWFQERAAALNAHMDALAQKSQSELTAIAGKIAAAGTAEIGASRAVAELQSELLRENQKIGQARKYLWMSTPSGEFLFGVPAPAFAKLNEGFDKNSETIKRDGHYKDRNDYLMKLVDMHDHVSFSDRGLAELESQRLGYYGEREGQIDWRFYKEQQDDYRYARPRSLVLSAPVTNAAGAVTGVLFLKVDDSAHEELYYSREYASRWNIYNQVLVPIFAPLAVISGLFLWFLLPSWVYIDAQERGVSNPGIWAFIALVSLIFGLAIYLITRPASMKSLHCPKCENQLNGGGTFCPHCGFDLSSTYCPQCQYPVKAEWSFCPNCRAGLTQRTSLQEPSEQLRLTESARDSATNN